MKVVKTLLLIVVMGLLLTGCGTAPVKVKLNPAANLNPDKSNQSLPVMVRMYQLATLKKFMQATFWQLWNSDQKTLGDSLLSKTVVTVSPNSPQEVTIKRDKQASYLGVVAIFRKPSGDDWRVLQTLGKPGSIGATKVQIVLHGNRIQVKKK